MEQIETTREMISALADGQLQGETFARGVELACTDAVARDAWHAYHLIGDVLRSGDLARASDPAAFVGRLQARLGEEAIPLQAGLAAVAQVSPSPAANDFRWKVAAGFASLTAVAAIAWTVIGVSSPKPDAAQLAAMPPGAVLAKSERGVMIRDPRLDELMAAHRQLGGAALVAPAGYLRNATFDGQGR